MAQNNKTAAASSHCITRSHRALRANMTSSLRASSHRKTFMRGMTSFAPHHITLRTTSAFARLSRCGVSWRAREIAPRIFHHAYGMAARAHLGASLHGVAGWRAHHCMCRLHDAGTSAPSNVIK